MKSSIILAEGITGKRHQQAKRVTNNLVKQENTSFSFCVKQVLKHDMEFLTSIVNYKVNDITPANLLPLLKGKEGINNKFTAWLVMTLVKRFYTVVETKDETVVSKSKTVETKVIAKGTKVKKDAKVIA